MNKITLEQYFEKCSKNNIIDFHLRISVDATKSTQFYIHPQYQSGDTADFYINGNELTNINYELEKENIKHV